MKHLAALLIAAAFAFNAPTASAQMGGAPPAGGDEVYQGFIRPKPSPSNAPSAAATGPKQPLQVSLATDAKSGGAGTTFAKSSTKVYLLVKDPTGAKGDKIRAVWIADDTAGKLSKGKKIGDFTQTLVQPGQSTSFFSAFDKGFPSGQYHVEVYENAKLTKSTKFVVTK